MLSTDSVQIPKIELIIGEYCQKDNVKSVTTIYQLTLDLTNEKTKKRLFGKLKLDQIQAYHYGMRKEFQPQFEVARKWSKSIKKVLQPKSGYLSLNYKIDSHNQRRLQCSIKLSKLIKLASDVKIYESNFAGLALPYDIPSKKRGIKST